VCILAGSDGLGVLERGTEVYGSYADENSMNEGGGGVESVCKQVSLP